MFTITFNGRGRKTEERGRRTEDRGRNRLASSLFCLLSSVFCLLSSPLIKDAHADGPGTTTGQLLKIPTGARAIGMGEAYVAEVNDSSSLQWNPAGLSYAEHKEASFMHSALLEGIHYEHLAYVSPGDNYSWGTSLSYLGYGDIQGYSGPNTPTGDLKAYSTIISGGLATLIKSHWSLGFTGFALQEKLDSESAWTIAGNVGGIYTFPSKPLGGTYKLGASVLNIGPGLKFISEREPLPRKIKFGATAQNIKKWPVTFTFDMTKPNDNDFYASFGTEYWFKQLLALRLGYAGSNDEGRGLRLGTGLKLRQFLFDYAYGGFGDFGATHRIQVAMQWGERVKQLNSSQRQILKDARRLQKDGEYNDAIVKLNELIDQDPTNTRALKEMILAHDKLLQSELKDAVAKSDNAADEILDPEKMALKELVPGQVGVAAGTRSGSDPLDVMGFENLPDVDNLPPADSEQMLATPKTAPTLHEAVQPIVNNQPEPVLDTPAPQPTQPADNGGVMINPADIYGN